jgi:uncharacterized protein YndB with AHSA1/START domain
MSLPAIHVTTPDCEIVTTRIFNSPREVVYKAWTDPKHLSVWWGPKGFTNTFSTFDLRVGGKWIFVMHGPEKGNYKNEVTFLVIREPELLIWDRQSQPLFQVEVIFEKLSVNQTRVIFKQKFKTEEECAKLRKYVPEKNEENMDRLEEELRKMKSLSTRT